MVPMATGPAAPVRVFAPSVKFSLPECPKPCGACVTCKVPTTSTDAFAAIVCGAWLTFSAAVDAACGSSIVREYVLNRPAPQMSDAQELPIECLCGACDLLDGDLDGLIR